MMGLEAVGDLALHTILSKLEAEDSARAACVSKKLRASASEDSLWSHFCARDLDLSQPLDPHGNLTPSFKVFPSNSYHLDKPCISFQICCLWIEFLFGVKFPRVCDHGQLGNLQNFQSGW